MDEDLAFKDFLSKLDRLGKGEWLVAYAGQKSKMEEPLFYSALIREDRVGESLKDPSWDLRIGDGRPGFVFRFDGEQQVASYWSPSDDGVEPLLLWRGFNGIRAGYWEVAEEFRLYFNLYEDPSNRRLLLIDDNGDEEDAVLISETEIKVKLRLIREFLAAKKMRLALFFDLSRFSQKSLDELGIEERSEVQSGEDFVFSIGLGHCLSFAGEGYKSQGVLIGKKLIPPATTFTPSLSSDPKKFVDFIIGVDENGEDILHTCNKGRLANYFGKNPCAPYYTTPVFFSKDVLTKYYSQPTKYSVQDGYLQCASLWGLRMDNNHSDYVMAFLGDLGGLSYKEQLHWRSFNLPSGKMSRTAFERSFEGKFADPDDPALFFKQKLAAFQEKWERRFGWPLFMPLRAGDDHYLKTLRVPLMNEQKEFDEQVLALAKVLIDSLNEKELAKALPPTDGELKGLGKLEKFLSMRGVTVPRMLNFLRKLQALRSTAAAHRKGEEYEKLKEFFSIGQRDLPRVFEDILVKCIWTLNSLEKHLVS